MQRALGSVAPGHQQQHFSLYFLLRLLFAAICGAEASTAGAARKAGSSGHGGGTARWTAWPVVAAAAGGGRRCAAVCGEAGRRRGEAGHGGGIQRTGEEEEHECGVDLEFSGFGEHARVLGVELDVGLGAIIPSETLRVYGLDEGIEFNYRVYQQRRTGDGSPRSMAVDNDGTHTVSIRIDDTEEAIRRRDSVTFRLEACGVDLSSVMGRGASVFVVEPGGVLSVAAAAAAPGRGSSLRHMFGVLPTYLGRRFPGRGPEQRWWQPRSLGAAAAATRRGLRSGAAGDGGVGSRREEAAERALEPAASAALSYTDGGVDASAAAAAAAAEANADELGDMASLAAVAASRAAAGRRKLQLEDCSADCLTSETERCQNNEMCETGGIGCNAQDDPLCQFCDLGAPYVECDEARPTEAPAPSPAPTLDPDYVECSSRCLESEDFPCFDDPSCPRDGNGIGCNATGDFYCRFCGFLEEFVDCPDVTPAPSLSPTVGPTPAPTLSPTLSPTPGPTPGPTSGPTPGSTSGPTPGRTPAPTPGPSPGPTAAPTTGPTAGPTAAPTAAPTAGPTTAATAAPTSSPTVAPTAAPTLTPTVADTAAPTAAPTVAVGGLGPASVKGSISASGVPDALVEEKGEEALVQEAVCALVECVDGLESVIVGEASVRRARSLLTLSSSRDEDWLRLGRRRRRLAEFEDVQFEVPTPTSAPVESEAEPLTGSKQAADLFNKAADESSLTGVASALGIDVADLSFGDLAYFEGDEFTFSSDFDQAEDEGASTWATVLVAFILVTAMLLCSCCTCLVVKHATEKGMDGRRRRAAAAAAARSPPRKSAVMQERLSTIEEEQGLRVGKSEMTASHSMGPSPHHSLIRSTSQEAGAVTRPSSSGRPKSVHRTHSIGSETSSAVSEKFVYTNPMHKHEKKLSPPNEYGDDLAQHYEGEVGDMSDISSELPHDKTDNPLFSSDSNRDGGGSSPTSVAEAARARGTGSRSMSGGGSGSGSGSRSGSGHLAESDANVEVDSYGASMSDAASTSLASSQSNTSESPLIDPAYSSSFDSDVDHHGGGEVAAEGSSLVGGRNPRGSGGVLSVTSETSSRMPFGLSPVAERTDSRGESPGLTTNSSSTTGGASTVYLARAGADGPRGVPWSYGGPDGGGSYSMASGAAGAEDDDAESVFRPPSPGSVSRPLQPLLAQQSPMSCVSGFTSKSNSFAMSSRSSSMASSFASPKAGGGAADAAAAASRLPAVGLRKGISNESLKAIKITSGGGDAEREAVREAVRRQRRKVARSLSQEDRRTEASSEGTAAMGEDELGSLGMDKIPRSSVSSLSPRARQRNEWRARYGSSQSELKFAEGGGGGGGGGGGSLAASSRMASGISDARLTSASTLSSFNGESIVSAMPSADARARSSGAARASPDSASAAGGGGVFGQSDTGSDASADAAAGHGDPSGSKGLASALDRRVKSAAVAPSPTHSRSGRAETGATKSESTVDEDGDEFYDATSTAGGGGGGGGGDGGGSVVAAAAAEAAAARVTATAASRIGGRSGGSASMRFSSRRRTAGRDSSRHAGGTAAAAATAATDARARDAETAAVVAAAEAAAAAATRTRAPQMMAGTRMSSSLSLSRSSSEASSLPSPVSIPSTSFQSHHAYMSGGGGSGGGGSSSGASSARAASAAAAAVAAAGVLDGTRGLDQASIVAAEECRDRAIEAGTAAAGAAVASGEVTTEAQLMAAGAVAAAKATKGRAVPDDVRRKAIQAGAAAAAAAAAADVGPPGGGVSNRWSTGTSAVELKSALKKETSFRSTAEKPRSVSFAYDSDGDDDDDYDSDGDGSSRLGGLRQHLADPSRPSGSYRRQESDSSSLSGESLSPSYRGSSATGGGDDVSQASFDTNSTFSAVSVSSYATATTTSTAYGGGRAGGGRGRDDAYSQRSSYSFRHDSSGSCSESDTDWPPSYQRGAGPLSSTIVAERKGEEEATGAHAATAGRRGGGRVLEDSAEAAAAAAAAITPRELGATTAGPAAAATAAAGEKKESTVSAYKKMFAAGGSGGGSSRSSSGESKRRMVMR